MYAIGAGVMPLRGMRALAVLPDPPGPGGGAAGGSARTFPLLAAVDGNLTQPHQRDEDSPVKCSPHEPLQMLRMVFTRQDCFQF